MNLTTILAILIIVGFVGYQAYMAIMSKRSHIALTEEEFRKDMRKAQVIDVREKAEFDGGHILGARNIPYSVFKTRMVEIRKDQPIYIYDTRSAVSKRAAIKLHRNGFKDIYRLKGGYDGWTGKTKRKEIY